MGLIGVFLLVPLAQAATIVSDYSVTLIAGQDRSMAPIMITATKENEIQAAFGMNLIIPEGVEAYWEPVTPTLRGTALEAGRVPLKVEVVYQERGKVLHIPVNDTFQKTEYLQVADLVVRAEGVGAELRLGLDLDGDKVPEVQDLKVHLITPDTAILLDRYESRYHDKCDGATLGDSACLWARIDLIYAQEQAEEVRVPELSLSARDLALMQLRRQWPKKRYEMNCVNVNEPAGYCFILAQALEKLHYFLDSKP